jgi:5'-deoxynucleotidase YfbR-like HD superfamily hydrolase
MVMSDLHKKVKDFEKRVHQRMEERVASMDENHVPSLAATLRAQVEALTAENEVLREIARAADAHTNPESDDSNTLYRLIDAIATARLAGYLGEVRP